MDSMRPAEVEAVIRFAKIGLLTLSERALLWCAFLGAIGAFGEALYEPDWKRSAVAAGYAILVLWPILRHEKKKGGEA